MKNKESFGIEDMMLDSGSVGYKGRILEGILNKLFYQKSSTTFCLSNFVAVGANYDIPFDTILANIGDNFYISGSGKITAKRECKVMVSATIWMYASERCWLFLKKNNANLTSVIGKSGADSYTSLTFAPFIVQMNAGDYLTIKNIVYCEYSNGSNTGKTTYITLQEL